MRSRTVGVQFGSRNPALIAVPAFLLFHGIVCGQGPAESARSASATLPDTIPAAWDPASDTPCFLASVTGWDRRIRERGWIVQHEGQWRLYYTGYDPESQPVQMKLGLAVSSDGIRWERHSEFPLYDAHWVEDMMIVRDGDRWVMFAEGLHDQAQMLTSEDGLQWARSGTLDVRLQDGSPIPPGPFGTPAVICHDGLWHLFYERRDAGIWLATSTDMKVWTNISDDPVLSPGPGEYDSLMIAMNQIVRTEDRFVAVLHGTGTPEKPRKWCTYFAESTDLRSWKKRASGPVLPIASNRSSGQLIRTDDHSWVLYTMHDRVERHLPAATQ